MYFVALVLNPEKEIGPWLEKAAAFERIRRIRAPHN